MKKYLLIFTLIASCKNKDNYKYQKRAESIVDSMIDFHIKKTVWVNSIYQTKPDLFENIKLTADSVFYFDVVDIAYEENEGNKFMASKMNDYNKSSFNEKRLNDEFLKIAKHLPDSSVDQLTFKYRYVIKGIDEKINKQPLNHLP